MESVPTLPCPPSKSFLVRAGHTRGWVSLVTFTYGLGAAEGYAWAGGPLPNDVRSTSIEWDLTNQPTASRK